MIKYLLALLLLLPAQVWGGVFVGFGQSTSSVDFTQDSNMLSYWYMEEDGTGDRLDGNNTNNNDLTPNATTPRTTTHIQGSYAIDLEADDYRSLSRSDANLSPSTFPGKSSTGAQNGFSVGGWIRAESISANQSIIGKGEPSASLSWQIGLRSTDNNFRGEWSDNGWGTPVSCANTNVTVSTGEWYFVVVTFTSTNTTVYVADSNDTSVTSSTCSNNPSVYRSSSGFHIGNPGNNSYRYDGIVDEVFILSTVLSESDINKILTKGLDGTR